MPEYYWKSGYLYEDHGSKSKIVAAVLEIRDVEGALLGYAGDIPIPGIPDFYTSRYDSEEQVKKIVEEVFLDQDLTTGGNNG